MQLPDLGHMTPDQIAGYLIPLAGLVFAVGFVRAANSATVLWTYLGAWLRDWLAPALLLVLLAIVGQGVPPYVQPNVAVQIMFIPAAIAWVLAALASIAKNLGLDLSKLPLATNVSSVFPQSSIKAVEPVSPTGNGPATPPNP